MLRPGVLAGAVSGPSAGREAPEPMRGGGAAAGRGRKGRRRGAPARRSRNARLGHPPAAGPPRAPPEAAPGRSRAPLGVI